nr:hypothetical protein [Tanacetum cinerariifolium]
MKIPQGFSKEGNCLNKIQEIKKQLDKKFSIKDLGSLKYFLGIEVAKTNDGLVLSQRKYTLDILKDYEKLGCKPSSFPIEQGLKLDKGEHEATVDASQYRRLIERLLYLQATRPDITYSVNVLSQFVADPRNNHLEAANRVFRYLKATPGQGILLSRTGDLALNAYCDTDWLGCSYTRRSRTGYFLLLGGAPISWKSKKQSLVSRSSAEAEYKAMASTVSEVLWVRWLLGELRVDTSSPTPLFCDNQAARHIANNPVFHERTKHVEMDYYFVRERVESKEIIPMYISSKMQVADLLTNGNCLNKIQEIKKQLDKEFSIKDLGSLKYFLRIEVAKTNDGLVLSQRKYTLDILKDCEKLGCKPSSSLIEQGLKLDKANRVLRYLKATPGQGILLFRTGDLALNAYCDADWLRCSYTRRSRTGYFLLLGGAPISWKSKKQSLISRSSAEAEYRAMAST